MNPEWKPHIYKVGPDQRNELDDEPEDVNGLRQRIEPWLSAVFQSEHLSLLVGNGLTTAIALQADAPLVDMSTVTFNCDLAEEVDSEANRLASASARIVPNVEDQIKSALALTNGLRIIRDARETVWSDEINKVLSRLIKQVLGVERGILTAIEADGRNSENAVNLLTSFLLSFASRAASRERLNVFTTNYDRILELTCDLAGLRTIDRFVGALTPTFRSSRLEVDIHYNPPGIRGEPRFLEGVVRLTKLHGSLDWRYGQRERAVRRYAIPFGAPEDHTDLPNNLLDSVLIYPNPAKDVETLEYPYAEMFRDFSSAICRPNSVLVTYGYGFGDDHINRAIEDMLTIPSTHLVVISWDLANGRVSRFLDRVGREPQVTMLIGSHFGSLENLVNHYLPKPAIDPISVRQTRLLEHRGVRNARSSDNLGELREEAE